MKTHVTINETRISLPNPEYSLEMNNIHNILITLDGLCFEKKEEQKPFSVDNKPKEHQNYFYVGGEYELKVCNTMWLKEDGTDISNLAQNNCFRTKEEAEVVLKRVL